MRQRLRTAKRNAYPGNNLSIGKQRGRNYKNFMSNVGCVDKPKIPRRKQAIEIATPKAMAHSNTELEAGHT
jgi:hypothetical protein